MPKYVIVVDDDKETREIVTFALKHNNFEVASVYNGQQLRQWLSTTSRLPDLIILDVMMPGEDGYQVCVSLRDNPLTTHIPIMMMTGHAEHIYERISTDLGVALHITKPFHPQELVERVQQLLTIE